MSTAASDLAFTDTFARRHIGPDAAEQSTMAALCGYPSVDALVDAAVPSHIRSDRPLDLTALPGALSEFDALARLRSVAAKNQVFRSFIGMGYHDTITPPVIQRNILENPGWYTQYTPYQAEISQGRLEGLLNFQTLVTDLTQLDIANASMLDEATACAEAMMLCHRIKEAETAASGTARNTFLVADHCHPQHHHNPRTRAEAQAGGEANPMGVSERIERFGGETVRLYPQRAGEVVRQLAAQSGYLPLLLGPFGLVGPALLLLAGLAQIVFLPLTFIGARVRYLFPFLPILWILSLVTIERMKRSGVRIAEPAGRSHLPGQPKQVKHALGQQRLRQHRQSRSQPHLVHCKSTQRARCIGGSWH